MRGRVLTIGLATLLGLSTRAYSGQEDEYRAALKARSEGRYSEAFTRLTALAADRVPEAQNMLGLMYTSGQGTDKDEMAAMGLFRSAAEQGFTPAMYQLGRVYQRRGDLETAYAWLKLAATRPDGSRQPLVAKSLAEVESAIRPERMPTAGTQADLLLQRLGSLPEPPRLLKTQPPPLRSSATPMPSSDMGSESSEPTAADYLRGKLDHYREILVDLSRRGDTSQGGTARIQLLSRAAGQMNTMLGVVMRAERRRNARVPATELGENLTTLIERREQRLLSNTLGDVISAFSTNDKRWVEVSNMSNVIDTEMRIVADQIAQN